jgi:hypothetical protein
MPARAGPSGDVSRKDKGMSVSIFWKLVKDDGHQVSGTSADWVTFGCVFGRRPLVYGDIQILVAMHQASRLEKSLWGDLANALNDLPEGAEIEVFAR